MIKFICLIVFLLSIPVQAEGQYLENVGLEKTRVLLSKAKQSTDSGTIYDKIYNEARKLPHLNGTDSESLFLDLYFSACFLENHVTLGQTPENLTDDLYSQMLRPLGSSVDVRLYGLELTAILSRVSGVFDTRYSQSDRSGIQSSFARLITGRGRFQLQEANVEQKTRLIMDIYRHYNLNDPKFSKHKNDFDFDSLWKEIVGKDFLVATKDKELSVQQVHALNCFIIAYFASKSEKYRLACDLRDVVGYLKNKVLIVDKVERKYAEPVLQALASYYYGIIAGQVEKEGPYAEPTLMDSFYETNLKQTTQRIAKINHQIRICKDGDVLPSLCDPYYDGGAWVGSMKVPRTASHYLGYFSDQHRLMPYDAWEKMNKVLGLFMPDSQDVWNQINASLSKNPLREGLSSILSWRIDGPKVHKARVDDPRYVKEETVREAAEKWRAETTKYQQDRVKAKEEDERYRANRIKRKEQNRQSHEEQKQKYVSTLQDLPLDKPHESADVSDQILYWENIKLWNTIRSLQYITDTLDPTNLLCAYGLVSGNEMILNIYEALEKTNFITTKRTSDGKENIYKNLDSERLNERNNQFLSIFNQDREKYAKEIQFLEIFKETIGDYCSGLEYSFICDDFWIREDAEKALDRIIKKGQGS